MTRKLAIPITALLSLTASLAHATAPVARFENEGGDGEICRTAVSAVGDGFVVSTQTRLHPQVAQRYRKLGAAWANVGPITLDTGGVFAACTSRFVMSGGQLIATQPNVDVSNIQVLSANGDDWHLDQTLTPDAPGGYGFDIAVDGDWLAVSAPSDDTGVGVSNAGVVYVYHRDNGVWTRSDLLRSPDPTDHASFGNTVAFAGGTLVIGEPQDSRYIQDPVGRAYVFTLAGGHWGFQHELSKGPHGAPAEFDNFGRHLAYNGQHLLVTSATTSNGTLNAYSWNGSAWVPAFDVTGDQLGGLVWYQIATVGDLVLVSGTRSYPESRLFVLRDLGDRFSLVNEVTAPSNAAAQGLFGWQTAFAGSALAVGAYSECVPPICPGATYIYDSGSLQVLFAADFD